MAANCTTIPLSLATTCSSSLLLGTKAKRFVYFSKVPYPFLSFLVTARSSKPKVSTDFAAAVNGDDVVSSEEEPVKLGNPTQVYVCNLPRSWDTEQLLHLFTPHGTVLSVEVQYCLLNVFSLLN